MKLGEILVRKGLISSTQVEQAITVQKICYLKLGELLVSEGWIQTTDIEQALLEQKWRQKGLWVID
ncbi:MAG: hypothetical protein ACKPEN_03725 [Planktothrix sp.]|uniref:hypothetical protein n=1 Tax=Planktothrix sp. TaxID=3088171 RepID=UPI0038D43B14